MCAIGAEQKKWALLGALAPAAAATLMWILTSWFGIKDGAALSASTRPRRLSPRQNLAAISATVASAAGVAVIVSPLSHGRPEIAAGCSALGLAAGLVALG